MLFERKSAASCGIASMAARVAAASRGSGPRSRTCEHARSAAVNRSNHRACAGLPVPRPMRSSRRSQTLPASRFDDPRCRRLRVAALQIRLDRNQKRMALRDILHDRPRNRDSPEPDDQVGSVSMNERLTPQEEIGVPAGRATRRRPETDSGRHIGENGNPRCRCDGGQLPGRGASVNGVGSRDDDAALAPIDHCRDPLDHRLRRFARGRIDDELVGFPAEARPILLRKGADRIGIGGHGSERIAEGDVHMNGARQGPPGGRRGVGRDRPGCPEHRHARLRKGEVPEGARIPPEEVNLIAGLRRARVSHLGRPVGRQDQQRNARLRGFDDCGEEVRRRGP